MTGSGGTRRVKRATFKGLTSQRGRSTHVLTLVDALTDHFLPVKGVESDRGSGCTAMWCLLRDIGLCLWESTGAGTAAGFVTTHTASTTRAPASVRVIVNSALERQSKGGRKKRS